MDYSKVALLLHRECVLLHRVLSIINVWEAKWITVRKWNLVSLHLFSQENKISVI
jgi:hypothetical protein